MQEFGLTYKWDNVWVVFSPFTNFKILKFLHLGFKHCFVILENCGNFFIVDPLAFKIEVSSFYLGKDNLFPYLQKMGMTVVKTNIKGDFKTNWHFSIFTCVEVVKRILGISKISIITPYQLYKYLVK